MPTPADIPARTRPPAEPVQAQQRPRPKPRQRKCAHPKCHTSIAYPRYACEVHWKQLPEDLRRRIKKAPKLRKDEAAPRDHPFRVAVREARATWDRQMNTDTTPAVYGAICGARRGTTDPPKAVVYRWICPYCKGTGAWGGGERCLNCHGHGLTNDVAGFDPSELTPAPRPPAVMKTPCVDCAYRPGSPEEEGPRPGPETAFFCHHGMHRIGDGYAETATIGALPLGAMVCAGWWALANGQPLPEAAFRDPGGSDRRADAPEQVG